MAKISIETKLLFRSLPTIIIYEKNIAEEFFFINFDFPFTNLMNMSSSSAFVTITISVATHLFPRATFTGCSHLAIFYTLLPLVKDIEKYLFILK